MPNILGVTIDNLTKKQILNKVEHFLAENKFHQIVTINPEFILEAQKNKEFQNILNNADLRVADGIGIRFALLVRAIWLQARMPGTDLMREIFTIAEQNQLKVFLAANKKGLSTWKETRDAIKKIFPNIKLYGANLKRNGQKLPSDISNCDIVLCNFGAPYQEKFAQSLKNDTIRLYMGTGGSFDYLTKKVTRAPRLMRIIGLEWLWRLLMQPGRWKRISNAVIVFPVKIILDSFSHSKQKDPVK